MTSPRDPDRPSDYDPQYPGQEQYPPYSGQGSHDPYAGGAPPPQYGGHPDYNQPPHQQPPYGAQPGGYPGHPGYAGGYGAPPAELPKGLAIAALVFGILALVLFWTVFGGIILGIVAIVLGIIGMRKASKGTGGGRGMAVTGLVLGILSLIGGIITAIIVGVLANKVGQTIQECQGLQGQEMQQCIQQNLPGEQSLGLGNGLFTVRE